MVCDKNLNLHTAEAAPRAALKPRIAGTISSIILQGLQKGLQKGLQEKGLQSRSMTARLFIKQNKLMNEKMVVFLM